MHANSQAALYSHKQLRKWPARGGMALGAPPRFDTTSAGRPGVSAFAVGSKTIFLVAGAATFCFSNMLSGAHGHACTCSLLVLIDNLNKARNNYSHLGTCAGLDGSIQELQSRSPWLLT